MLMDVPPTARGNVDSLGHVYSVFQVSLWSLCDQCTGLSVHFIILYLVGMPVVLVFVNIFIILTVKVVARTEP